MVFSSAVFLFLFLPLVIALNFLLLPKYRNFFLLIVSLLFYSWGEGDSVLIMLISVSVNYFAGIVIAQSGKNGFSRLALTLAIIINLSFLFYFKYLNFFLGGFGFDVEESIVLPIGISFYIFHGISYLVDVYQGKSERLKDPFDLALYISFFPQLVAGPIIRYSDVESQLHYREVNVSLFFEGTLRFIRGLGKKVLIANTCALIADNTFVTPIKDIPTLVAWTAILCYTLQIYFDFSGYSDMAIGLAKMFGFTFKENFNYPYVATSIQDFWRRWHISLSTWFRDYVYIPLGGSKQGKIRTYLNLLIVFLITGLWHGASYNFILWGLYHGFFIVLERSEVINLKRTPQFLKHIYVLLIVIIGWIFFRIEYFPDAMLFMKSLLGFSLGSDYTPLISINSYSITLIILGVIFSTPLFKKVDSILIQNATGEYLRLIGICSMHIILFFFTCIELAHASYNPFIYFRF